MKVLVMGTFDDLHPGHLFLLNEASKRGELCVIVGRDANVTTFKGRPPVQSEEERMAAIRNAFPAADVRLGDATDFLKPVRDIGPDLILLGYDQKLPPSIKEEDLPCPTERLPGYKPNIYKSSLRRK